MKETKQSWIILIAITFIYLVSNGIGFYTIPNVLPAIANEYGWNIAKTMQAPTYFSLVIALFAYFAGYILDRFSIKKIMIIGVLGLVFCLAFFPYISSFTQLIIYYILYAISLSFCGIIPSMYFITQWFDKNRSLAVGILLNASSLGAVLFSQIYGSVLVESDWRKASLTMNGIGILIILIPLFFLKDRKENNKTILKYEINSSNKELIEALKSPFFYILISITTLLWFCIFGYIQNKGFYLSKDLKLSIIDLKNIDSIFFISAIVGKVGFGFLADKFNKKWIMIISILNIIIGLLLMKLAILNTSLVFLFAIIFGAGYSGNFTMIQALIAEFYAGKSYGRILGLFTMIDTLGGMLGIIVLGTMRTQQNTYSGAINLMIFLIFISLIACVLLKKPQKPLAQ
jgi:MFS transporter, OFA family, oxalate/formate antiporter